MTDFARIRTAAKSSVDMNEVVRHALRLASFDKKFLLIETHLQLAENITTLVADEDQLQQVVLNLILNARDAMPDGGSLSIATFQNETDIRIDVSDTGTGIDPDNIGHVFDPFYTTKPAGHGTGLGLAVCYGIISAHDGTIEVRSNSGNSRGSTFTVILPLTSKKLGQRSVGVDTRLDS